MPLSIPPGLCCTLAIEFVSNHGHGVHDAVLSGFAVSTAPFVLVMMESVKLPVRTNIALSQGHPTMLPPGMKRVAQTISQPLSASATIASMMVVL